MEFIKLYGYIILWENNAFIYKGFIFAGFTGYYCNHNTGTCYFRLQQSSTGLSALSGAVLAIGTFLIVLGLGFVIYTNHAFFRIGKGTLAPWDPPKKLVVAGAYGYVRNPMISGVLMIVLGETLIFASIELFILFFLFFIVNHVYFVYSEEPGLEKRFGNDYIVYKKNVPRWIPRLKPWKMGKW